jgi:hypothetical protein
MGCGYHRQMRDPLGRHRHTNLYLREGHPHLWAVDRLAGAAALAHIATVIGAWTRASRFGSDALGALRQLDDASGYTRHILVLRPFYPPDSAQLSTGKQHAA